MYGTRDAAQNWAEEYSSCLTNVGYVRGIANSCLSKHSTRDVCLTVHGDDFVGVVSEEDLAEVRSILEGRYKITVEVLGPDASKGETREVKILNRVVRWADTGI